MRIKCVAIDDEPLALEKLTTYIPVGGINLVHT